eukprot:286004_1
MSASSRQSGGFVSPRPLGSARGLTAITNDQTRRKSRAVPSSRVQVAVRIRPFNRADGANPEQVVHADHEEIVVQPKTKDGRPRSFMFDHVFTGAQSEVYQAIGVPLLEDGFTGFNTCVFAYGQTGSGKTYSIQGEEGDAEGLLPRLCRDMLELQAAKMEADTTLNIKLTMSFLEIYNEKIRDLLVKQTKGQEPETLEVHEETDSKGKRVFVDGLGVHTVTTLHRIAQLVHLGNSQRQTS